MATDFQLVPPLLSVFILLGTGGLVAGLLLAAAFHAVRRRGWAAKRDLRTALSAAGFYGVALVGFGSASRDVALDPGSEKHLCEVSCRLAYSIADSRWIDGRESRPRRLLVLLRTRFDEAPGGPGRGQAPLIPRPRRILVMDGAGRQVPASGPAETGLPESEGGFPLDHPLRPGESYLTPLVFALPPDAEDLRLFVGGADWPTHLLLGHENGPFYGKTWLKLPD